MFYTFTHNSNKNNIEEEAAKEMLKIVEDTPNACLKAIFLRNFGSNLKLFLHGAIYNIIETKN